MHHHELPATLSCRYLNTGAAAPLPQSVHASMQAEAEWEFANGRVGTAARARFFEALASLKEALARATNCGAERIAITESTTVGLNIAIWGLGLGPGDQIVVPRSEHSAAIAALISYRRRVGVEILVYDDEQFELDELFALFTPRTRAIVISHVSWHQGRVHPIEEICRRSRQLGVKTIVDGAQAFGAVPVDLAAIRPDYYVFPAQKWSFGPEGIAALMVDEAVDTAGSQTFSGPFSFRPGADLDSHVPADGAAKYEIGTRYRATVRGWLTALEWLEAKGWETVFAASARQRVRLREMLRGAGHEVVDVEGAASPLLSLRVPPHAQADQLAADLDQRSIKVRSIPGTNLLRASTAFFVSDEDLSCYVDEYSSLVARS